MGEKYLNYLNKQFMIKISNLFYPKFKCDLIRLGKTLMVGI